MKILIIQERGRHAENENFREALNFKRAFKRLGIESYVHGPGYECPPYHFNDYRAPFPYLEEHHDVMLILENYETGGWLKEISQSKKLKIFWSIDSHCALDRHLETCDRYDIDILLNSTRGYLSAFEKPGRKCIWFPNCYPSDLIEFRDIPKAGVGFCGNSVNRGAEIVRLVREVDMRFDRMVIGDSMVNAVNSYAIHWNRNMADDINYRTFETLGCKTMLLTNFTDGLDELFNPGEHLVTYWNMDDCIDKIRYYLHHEEERERIAQKGYEHVRKHHTYDVRAKQLLDIIKETI